MRASASFRSVVRSGVRAGRSHLVVHASTAPGPVEVGFVVSRRVGPAVVRNRVKRRLREQFRPFLPRLKKGYYVVVARESAARADSAALGAALLSALRRQKLLADEPAQQTP